MRGIKLMGQRDQVVGAFLAVENQYVWTITDNGVAKISAIEEFPTQGRAGSGVIAMRLPEDSLAVRAATIGRQDDNIVVLTNKHKPKYMRVGLAQKTQTRAQWRRLCNLYASDRNGFCGGHIPGSDCGARTSRVSASSYCGAICCQSNCVIKSCKGVTLPMLISPCKWRFSSE